MAMYMNSAVEMMMVTGCLQVVAAAASHCLQVDYEIADFASWLHLGTTTSGVLDVRGAIDDDHCGDEDQRVTVRPSVDALVIPKDESVDCWYKAMMMVGAKPSMDDHSPLIACRCRISS